MELLQFSSSKVLKSFLKHSSKIHSYSSKTTSCWNFLAGWKYFHNLLNPLVRYVKNITRNTRKSLLILYQEGTLLANYCVKCETTTCRRDSGRESLKPFQPEMAERCYSITQCFFFLLSDWNSAVSGIRACCFYLSSQVWLGFSGLMVVTTEFELVHMKMHSGHLTLGEKGWEILSICLYNASLRIRAVVNITEHNWAVVNITEHN